MIYSLSLRTPPRKTHEVANGVRFRGSRVLVVGCSLFPRARGLLLSELPITSHPEPLSDETVQARNGGCGTDQLLSCPASACNAGAPIKPLGLEILRERGVTTGRIDLLPDRAPGATLDRCEHPPAVSLQSAMTLTIPFNA